MCLPPLSHPREGSRNFDGAVNVLLALSRFTGNILGFVIGCDLCGARVSKCRQGPLIMPLVVLLAGIVVVVVIVTASDLSDLPVHETSLYKAIKAVSAGWRRQDLGRSVSMS